MPADIANAQARPAEKRIALVIGNSQYPKAPLSNPENDARVIAANLRRLGFEVNEQLNMPVLQFRRALREFARRVQQDDAIAVLYYAGHGLQIDGRNYLLPVDINLRDQEEVKDESVDIDELFLSRIDKVGSYPRIVILDACRNNPFASKTRNIRSAGGLAEMGARGTLIAFASAPGAAAEDGPDGGNSIYTKSLAEEMMTPGIEVEQMFKNVRVKVLRDTAGRQLPWVNTSLTSDFSFNPSGARPSTQLAAGRPEQGARPPAGPAPPRSEPEPLTSTKPTAAPSAAPLPAPNAGGATSRAKEPKDIETALALARREQSAPVAAPAPTPPAVPAATTPAPAPPPTVASPPPSPSAPAPATQLALQTPSPNLASPQQPPSRRLLDHDEVQKLLIGKVHTLKDKDATDVIRLDLRSSGLLYYSSHRPSAQGINGAGRWNLMDDGRLCTKINPSLIIAANARKPDDGCWYIVRDGEKLVRAVSTSPQEQPQTEIVKIE
ncbi:caspase family protein [Variovorax sp. J22R133]|uniref:caspase family protein n=1 Tax=Variovorax brevis TaxID=3053503 RepID=UPI0025790D89|nr:caspase family protein [Variovorax sp. J22R133]MDM0115710.1 caspase family protein [Variovorax sp. J22R133]